MLVANAALDRALQSAFAFRESKVLFSALELGVFTALGDDSASAAELTARTRISPRGARDFFDALVSLGFLYRCDDGKYTNLPEMRNTLITSGTNYIGGLCHYLSSSIYPAWMGLTAAIRSGESQSGPSDAGGFSAFYEDASRARRFLDGMSTISRLTGRELARSFPWADFQAVVDVGCAQGCALSEILEAHDHLIGCGFDLPAMEKPFLEQVGARALSDRLTFQCGDFFVDDLPRADVIILGRVLHNWAIPERRKLIRKAYDCLGDGGALIVYERLIDDGRRSNGSALMSSLNMLMMTDGGSEFSALECIDWMQNEGFQHIYVESLVIGQSMVVARKLLSPASAAASAR